MIISPLSEKTTRNPAIFTALQTAVVAALVAVPLLGGCAERGSNEAAPESPPTAEVVASSSILTVTDAGGTPLGGAMVSVSVDENRRLTRFTDSSGRLDLRELPVTSEPLSHQRNPKSAF